ncbi:MAG: rRNA maturation RNase YbeY [Pseudomonadota bacterium]
MSVETVIEDIRWAPSLEALSSRAIPAALAHLSIGEGYVVVMGCDDARIAALNADFRGKPAATNVLSWPSQERRAAKDGATPKAPSHSELGDLALAFETCAREAHAQSKTFDAHVTHLLIHGTLHLLGYDHERTADAELMERLEIEILGKMGYGDPYSTD